jgi:poly-gamma-glutamate capsule biosynthesis protein CapA/YwtB (metallophosphatase superfamily)
VAGAGASLDRARDPAIVDLGSARRILVFAVGAENSGIPKTWAATTTSSGVDLLPDLSDLTADDLVSRVHTRKRRGDVAVVSIHWLTTGATRYPTLTSDSPIACWTAASI